MLRCGGWDINIAHPENVHFTKHITDNSTMSIFSPGITFDHSRGSSALDYAFPSQRGCLCVGRLQPGRVNHYPISISFKSATAPKKYIIHLAIQSDSSTRKNFENFCNSYKSLQN